MEALILIFGELIFGVLAPLVMILVELIAAAIAFLISLIPGVRAAMAKAEVGESETTACLLLTCTSLRESSKFINSLTGTIKLFE